LFSAWLVGWFVHGGGGGDDVHDGAGGDDRGLAIRFFAVQTLPAGRLGHGSACPRISVCKARVSSAFFLFLSTCCRLLQGLLPGCGGVAC